MFCSQFPKSRIFRPHTKLAISKGKQAIYNKEINFLIFFESEITVSKKINDKFALRGVWMTCMSREHDVSPRTVTRNANVIHSSRVCLAVWCEIPSNDGSDLLVKLTIFVFRCFWRWFFHPFRWIERSHSAVLFYFGSWKLFCDFRTIFLRTLVGWTVKVGSKENKGTIKNCLTVSPFIFIEELTSLRLKSGKAFTSGQLPRSNSCARTSVW